MSYILESHHESERLEKQNAQPQYSIEEELEALKLNLNEKKILDAGCGTGCLSRILEENFRSEIHACDASEFRIQNAKNSSNKDINYFVADLTALPCPNDSYDVIFIRFVLEHTLNPNSILQELHRVLRPGGHLVVIDLDGLIFNLHHKSEKLSDYLELLQKQLPLDLYIGRKLPRMMCEAGLILSECRVQPLLFQGKDLEEEVENMLMRFDQSKAIIMQIIGSENYETFTSLYISEMRKSQTLFCNKFIVSSTKPKRI